MKILFVENMIIGHHVPYVQALSGSCEYDSVIITPEKIDSISVKQLVFPKMDFNSRKLPDYMECISFIAKTAEEEKADIIHFLDGDKIMRYFGLGMNRLSKICPVVITYHHLFEGTARRISYMLMSRGRTPVVHTEEFQRSLEQYGIHNTAHVEYPSFLENTGRRKKNEVPVIGMFGGTRHDKGLDILMEALAKVESPFRLLVAGREADFSREEIEEMCASFRDKVTLDLRFLTEKELAGYWDMTDLVVLPYRAIFDGASGQLTEGVNREIPIIGPEHGSLGSIITENHLGATYRTEDSDDLAAKIEEALTSEFAYDKVAKAYKRQMSPERFCDDYLDIYRSLI